MFHVGLAVTLDVQGIFALKKKAPVIVKVAPDA